MADKYVLMDLDDDKSKEIATVLNSKTSKKILDYLSEHETATESEISKSLSVAISTVHYNISVLIKARLVESQEYHYSKKGREVNHYKLANKLIIISPSKMDESAKEKLKSLFMTVFFGAVFAVSGFMGYVKSIANGAINSVAPMASTRMAKVAVDDSASMGVMESSPMAAQVMVENTSDYTVYGDAGVIMDSEPMLMAAKSAPENVDVLSQSVIQIPFYETTWFVILVGVVIGFALFGFIYYLVKYLRIRKK